MKIFIKGQEIALKNDLSTVYKYKGSVANEASLPTENNAVGDVYNCEDTGNNFAWTGTAWDKLAGTIDLSNYYTKAQADARTEDIIAGTVDLSNYYTKSQSDARTEAIIAATIDINNYYTKEQADASTEAIVEERITELGTDDLLHYKGHVANIEQLPSLGQATGVRGVNNLDAVIHNNGVIGTVKYDETFGITEPYYLVWRRYSQSVESSQPYLYLCCIETTNPEGISVVAFKKGAHISSSADNVGNIGFYVKPTAEHPVYYRNSSEHGDAPLYMFKKEADETWTRTYIQRTQERVQLETDVEYIFAGYYAYGPLPLFSATVAHKNILLSTNFGRLKFKYIDLNSTSYVLYDSIKYGNDAYYYNDGMYIFETAGTDNREQVKYVTNVTNTKLNDVYTVGDNYDIYRRNELPAWEHWSQGVSKEYVDSIVGGVNTELENIINGD